MRRAGPSRLKYWILPLVMIAILLLRPSLWLRPAGAALIRDDGPAKADIALVMAGDETGNRILKAAELVRNGYVPAVLVSGPEFYGMHECDAAIPFAVSHGYPREWFIGVPNSALSTREEARVLLAELGRRGVHSFLLVTSDYHTGRSGRIFRAALRRLAHPLEMRVVAAPDKHFRLNGWWRSREGLKTVFMEWSKTVAAALGA